MLWREMLLILLGSMLGTSIIIDYVTLNTAYAQRSFEFKGGGVISSITPSLTSTQAGYQGSRYTGYTLTVASEDNGQVRAILAWQVMPPHSPRVYDSYLTLQIIKTFEDGSLDHALTYIPLYLVQYEDQDNDGLLTLQFERQSFAPIDEAVGWRPSQDKILKVYPLLPFDHSSTAMRWRISKSLLQEDYLYNWNASLTIRGFEITNGSLNPDTIDSTLQVGYHLRMQSSGLKVKVSYKVEDVNWSSGSGIRLALISTLLYQSKEQISLREVGVYKTSKDAYKMQNIDLVTANERIKSSIFTSADAYIDGSLQRDIVSVSLQPLFIFKEAPQPVKIRDIKPMFEERMLGGYSIAFAHQISFPRFNRSVFQDPEIYFSAPIPLPSTASYINLGWIIAAALTITVILLLIKVVFENRCFRNFWRFPESALRCFDSKGGKADA
ncbi:MAG: hypothetical protein QXN08_06150 [Nitrososphaerales archaeon]